MWEIILGIIKELLGVFNKLLDGVTYVLKAINIACLPSHSDKERYELIMRTVYVHSIYHFRNNPTDPFLENRIQDGIEENAVYLNGGIYLPTFKNRKLRKKEKILAKTARELFNEIDHNIDATRSANGYTIQDTSKNKMIKLHKASQKLIDAFESFRDYGSKLFSSKITREVNNG